MLPSCIKINNNGTAMSPTKTRLAAEKISSRLSWHGRRHLRIQGTLLSQIKTSKYKVQRFELMLKKLSIWIATFFKKTIPKKKMKKANPLSVNGFTEPGFEKVADTFRANLKSGLDKGASFAVYYQGRLVVNLWGGYSDIDCRRLWKEDTLSTFFSSTKAVSAIVIAHLVDRGWLDYKRPVCSYWPDFAQNGKEKVTLEQLISNQAGLITLEEPYWLAELKHDPVKLGKKLASQKPFWTPGEKHGYHPLTFGLYLDQIVRHADLKQRSLSEYFKEEIAQPFDIEIYIGLPKCLYHRGTRNVLNKQYDKAEYAAEQMKYFKGDPELQEKTNNLAALDFKTVNIELYIGLPKPLFHRATRVIMARPPDQSELLKKFKGDLNLLMQTANNPQDFKTTLKINDPDNRELPIPSTHGHATASNMAKLFGIVGNGGMHNGKRLLSHRAIERFTQPLVAGIDASFGIDAAWSVGTHLITMVTGDQHPNHIFGHGGYGGQYAAADIKHKVGFAYTTPFLDPFSSYSDNGDERMYSLVHAMYDCIFKIENIQEERILFQHHSQYEKYLKQNATGSKL